MMLLNNRLPHWPWLVGICSLLVSLLIIVYYFFLPPEVIYPILPLDHPLTISPKSPLTIRFNRPVSQVLIPTLDPDVNGEWHYSGFSWFKTALSFTPKEPLLLGSEYVVNLDRILPIAWFKLNQATNFLFVFNTPPNLNPPPTPSIVPTNQPDLTPTLTPTPTIESVNLKVPLFKQHYTFTCYSAASQMVLGYRDINVGELTFLDEIGYDKTPRNRLTGTWGDPNIGIVGTYNGQGEGGYGVHWQPVANALAKYRPITVKRQWNLAELLTEVKAGNPVMVWWVNGVWPAKDISWKNSQGESVYTVNGMHVEVVKGYVGTPESPQKIYTNDPWRGYRTYTPAAFNKLWAWFDNTAVIVY